MLDDIDFGDYAAETDKILNNEELFVHTRQHQTFNLPKHRIIFGRKGAGKTALVQHITSQDKNKYAHILNINADSLRFKPMTEQFSQLYETIGGEIELRKSFSNIWEHSILVSCMAALLPTINTKIGEGAVLHNYLRKEGILEKRIYDLLLDSLENLFSLACQKKAKYASELLKTIDNYPLENANFEGAKIALSKLVNDRHNFLITFDRIDTYFQIDPSREKPNSDERETLRYVLAGLVQSVYNISTSIDFRENIQFKVFLPLDRYKTVQTRDWDKIKKFIYKISWNHDELVDFVAKRISHSLDLRDDNGKLLTRKSETWHKIFNKTVPNKTIGNIPEDIDKYIIRHTQYKPRDIQYYCSKIIETAQINIPKAELPISAKIIRNAINNTTRELVENFFIEYQYDNPYLKKMINLFRERSNIMQYSKCSKALHNILNRFILKEKLDVEANKLIRTLYNVGFLGGITIKPDDSLPNLPHRKIKGNDYWFRFACFDPNFNLQGANKIVIHPMFNEYLQLAINTEIIVG